MKRPDTIASEVAGRGLSLREAIVIGGHALAVSSAGGLYEWRRKRWVLLRATDARSRKRRAEERTHG